jgi:hypothetical protein
LREGGFLARGRRIVEKRPQARALQFRHCRQAAQIDQRRVDIDQFDQPLARAAVSLGLGRDDHQGHAGRLLK